MPLNIVGHFARLLRFGAVGLSAAALYAVLVMVLTEGARVDPVLASAIAYGTGIPFSYVGQRLFTFRSSNPVGREFGAFVVVQAMNFGLAVALTYLVTDVLGMRTLVAVAAVIAAVALTSYAAMSLGVFARRR